MDKRKRAFETFNDGVLSVYGVNRDGMDETLYLKIETLRYAERTVGFKRYYDAKQANVEIAFVIRIPRRDDISTQDVVILRDGTKYAVRQVQFPPDTSPPCSDLSLERLEVDYDLSPIR